MTVEPLVAAAAVRQGRRPARGRLKWVVLLSAVAFLSGGCGEQAVCGAGCANRIGFYIDLLPSPTPQGRVEFELCHESHCVAGATMHPLVVDETTSAGAASLSVALRLRQDGSVMASGQAQPATPPATGDTYRITIRDLDTASVLAEHVQTADPSRYEVCGQKCASASLCFSQEVAC